MKRTVFYLDICCVIYLEFEMDSKDINTTNIIDQPAYSPDLVACIFILYQKLTFLFRVTHSQCFQAHIFALPTVKRLYFSRFLTQCITFLVNPKSHFYFVALVCALYFRTLYI